MNQLDTALRAALHPVTLRIQDHNTKAGNCLIRVTEGEDVLGLVQCHVSNRHGVTLQDWSVFDLKMLGLKDKLRDFAYYAIKDGVRQRVLL
jgi:hypothetical protein